MGIFKPLQRKSSTVSKSATPTSHWLRSSRPLAPTRVPPSEQVSSDQQTQPAYSPRLKYSLADIPIFPSERENRTGLPNPLKAGIEKLSGMAMDDVHVHYNSSRPAELQALAYTQSTEIHVGPGQEKHLPHEAWHVVQQKQGRVKTTIQVKGVAVTDDEALEQEAERMGAKAVQDKCISTNRRQTTGSAISDPHRAVSSPSSDLPIQRYIEFKGKPYRNVEEIPGDLLFRLMKLTSKKKDLFHQYLGDEAHHTIEDIEALTEDQVSELLKPVVEPPKPEATITSETVAENPGERTRTTIGVGEQVNLKYSAGKTEWATTGGRLNTFDAYAVLHAPDTRGKVTVTADHASIDFDVKAPSGVHMDRVPGKIWHTEGRPDIGIQTKVYLLPDTVNFYNVQCHELDVEAVATGAYACHHGSGHQPREKPYTLTESVIPGKGTLADARDDVYSGDCKTEAPFGPGSISFAIPLEYRVGDKGQFHEFATVDQECKLADNATTLTAEKAGAEGKTNVKAGTSTYDTVRPRSHRDIF